MALRVKVELVPHGFEPEAEVLDEIIIANNGTGIRGGLRIGGVGNYDIYDGLTIKQLQAMDYPGEKKVGEVRELERSPDNRLKLARFALEVVEGARG